MLAWREIDLNLMMGDLASWGLHGSQVRLLVTYCDWFAAEFVSDLREALCTL